MGIRIGIGGLTIGSSSSRGWTPRYVRPTGTTYGTGDGKTYDNAWSGFSEIVWADLAPKNAVLYVCGTHSELLSVGASGESGNPIIISGRYLPDPGLIDGEDTLLLCLDIDSKDYITLNSLTLFDATRSCLNIRGTSSGVITNDLEVYGSGNQGVQHLDTASATHNNIKAHDNVDDGISGHSDAIIVVNGGLIKSNDQGVNVISAVSLTMNDVVFEANTSFDLYLINSVDDGKNPIGIATNCIFNSNVRLYNKSITILNNCSILGLLSISDATSAVTLTANNCVIANASLSTNTLAIFNDSLVLNFAVDLSGDITFNRCYIKGSEDVIGAVKIYNSLLYGGTDHYFDIQSGGSVDSKYNVFYGMAASKYGIFLRASSYAIVEGCSFVGVLNAGLGVGCLANATVENCIFTSLATGLLRSGGTVISNNCCYYDNDTDVSGTVTQKSSVTTDPKLTLPASLDFSLGVGSSCIGAGKTLTEATAIDSANWGNGTTAIPSVITKEQGAAWDIGAYVS